MTNDSDFGRTQSRSVLPGVVAVTFLVALMLLVPAFFLAPLFFPAWFMKSDPKTQEFKDAVAALDLAVKRNIDDLKSDPARYFVPKVGIKCTVLHLTAHYLGQTCLDRTVADPPGDHDYMLILAQGPVHEQDGWLYGSLDTYFSDPSPHGARTVATIGRDMVAQITKD